MKQLINKMKRESLQYDDLRPKRRRHKASRDEENSDYQYTDVENPMEPLQVKDYIKILGLYPTPLPLVRRMPEFLFFMALLRET